MKPRPARLLCFAASLLLAACPLLRSAITSYSPDASTLALWKFDETANPPASYAEASGNTALTLVKTGTGDLQSVPGLLGNAVAGFHPQTASVNRRLYINSYAHPANPSAQTFEAWVRFDAGSWLPHETPSGSGWANKQVVFRRAGTRQPISLYFTDDNTGENSSLTLEIRNSAGASRILSHPLGRSVERGRWYHIACTIRQSGIDVIASLYFQDEFGGYDDAPPAATATFADFTYDTGVFPISIGEAGQTGVDPFTGTIDEARLSNVVRATFATHPPRATRFPVSIDARIHHLGGTVRGVGVLVSAGAGGPKAVHIRRTTTVPANETIKPRPVTLARVMSPDGKIVALADLTDDATGQTDRVLSVPDGPAGVYTVNIIGGRNNDLVAVGLPDGIADWGVRGEASLGVVSGASARDYYLYLPRTYTTLRMSVYGSTPHAIGLYNGAGYGTLVAEIGGGSVTDVWNSSLSRYELTIPASSVPASTPSAPSVLRVRIPAGFDKTLVFDGVPGLLCVDEASAVQLAGGTLESHGLLVGGPLQKRARDWMWAQHQVSSDYTLALDFPASVSTGLPDPQFQALPYGKYGLLTGLQPGLANQVLDPDHPFFGANLAAPRASWETFQYGGLVSSFDTLALANAYSLPFGVVGGKKINPAHLNANALRRSVLYAFYHFVSMDGSQLLREGGLASGSYPITHTFFAYYSLAQAYYQLVSAGGLDPVASDIWRDGLLALGGKNADYRGYQSNQWGHMMLGHLYTYLTADEPRFLKWFEEQFAVYLDGGYGTNSKFGRHPAGYFLEEYGPDGNYDSMNLYVLVEAYHLYRELPEADLVLVEKMRAAIEDNLAFKSFIWLPQPGVGAISPTAMNSRVAGTSLATTSYPGISMARFEFPLALKRHLMTPVPGSGAGAASTFSHLVSTDTWALNFLNWALPIKDTGFANDMSNPSGTWAASLHHAYRLPPIAAPAVLPAEHPTDATWNLPGLVAWKKAGLYGASFYAVDGGRATIAGKLGGGPTALWSPQTGAILVSSQNNQSPLGAVTAESHITHSAVYWTTAGTLHCSGRLNNATGQWLTPGEIYEITETTAADGTSRTIRWTYDLAQPAGPRLTVSVDPLPPDLMVNLPVYSNASDGVGETIDVSQPGEFTFAAGGKTFSLTWPGGAATLSSSNVSTIRRLAIPMTASPMEMTMSLD